ncbi:MAG: LysR family transcriptional regulator [Candidatus Thiodiazotropha sp. (ex Dulcina madagascariensis)]|nr:LysR family transcriptional regulator [Candidatus Thiodiazotropha sp. (ex Dulcina madagascariensis)]MCU7926744.1 LysR family transcriptional regulator [Candidatus Thiodiazotropha sp. (ex Dulcina madagascariensis)]
MLKQRQQQFLDNRLFRAFMAAAETENFTSAAKRTFMTQSGISQHIARLEEQVGLPLFKRVAKHVTLTNTGKRLRKYIEEHSTQTETFLGELREEYNGATGLVSYAMPPSCLLSPHFPLLLEKRKQYPLIRLDVSLAPSHDVIRMVLEDQVDFGFVTKKTNHPNLAFNLFCQEEYILTAASPRAINGINENNIFEQPSIAYPGVDVYFNNWLRYHFPKCRNLDFLSLPISGNVNSIDGAIKMVQGGLGISVFPRHCIDYQLDHGELFEFQNEKPPLFNDIYIVSLQDFTYPRVVRLVMAWFYNMHCPS